MNSETGVWDGLSDSHSQVLDTRANGIGDLEDQQISADELEDFRCQWRAIKATVKATSFEDAQDLSNFPGDHELEEFLQWHINHPHEEDSYSYWCREAPTPRDFEFLTPLGGAAFYEQLVGLISEKTRIVQSPYCEHPPENQAVIDQVLQNYRQQLARQVEEFQQRVLTNDYPAKTDELFGFHGLRVCFGDQEHDLSRSQIEIVPGWLSNVIPKSRSFVQYVSSEALKRYYFQKHDGRQAGFEQESHRIYLNSDPEHAVAIARSLIERFENPQAPLPVTMLIHNRATEAGGRHLLSVRSEGMVLYTREEHTNAVLEAVLSCYKQHYLAFAQRTVPKLTAQIADGVSMASQEGFDADQVSFIKHRSELFDAAWQEFKYYQEAHFSATVTSQDVQVFKQCLAVVLGKNDIDTQNLAFPASGNASNASGFFALGSSSVVI